VDISVVIRTFNEEQRIGAVLEKLRAQKGSWHSLEIVIVDSGSSDKTLEIAQKYDTHIITMKPEDFNYSAALNMGIELAKGDIIVIISGHAVPCSDDWLEKLALHFNDSRVAGVYCRQIPWPDAPWHEIERLESQFPPVSRRFSRNDSLELMHFSNAASCIGRKCWIQHPFSVASAAEDFEWSELMIRKGYDIVYEAGGSVFHSHNDSPREAAKRLIAIERAMDSRLCRKRSLLLTIRQGLGRLYRDIRQIHKTPNCHGKKLSCILESTRCVFWFMVNFKASDLPRDFK